MKQLHNYRQGDIALIGIKTIPKGLKETKTNTFLAVGSGGNPHTFKGGKFYAKPEGDFILGYFKAKGSNIYHPEHSPKGDKIADGVYAVRKQVEFTHEGLRPVVD